jgi:ParB family chromosome partitioning protein
MTANPKSKKKPINLDFLQGSGGHTDLSGLFASAVATESDVRQAIPVSIEKLLNNPYQPRNPGRDDNLDELAGVIKSQGFQGVLVARPDGANKGFYQLTAGHRRREAARRAGLTTLPVVVRELSDEEMVTLAITENIQREDLTPLEEGKIYLLMSEEMGYTHEQVAREIGKKRGYVENRIRVARAPRDVQALVMVKPDSLRAVANLIKVKDEADRAEIIEGMLAGTLTVEDLPGYIAAKAAMRQSDKVIESAARALGKLRDELEAEGKVAAATSRTEQPSQTAPLEEAEPPNTRQEQPATPQATFLLNGQEIEKEILTPHIPQYRQAESVINDKVVEERGRIRIGSAKLAAALRYLTTYKEQSEGRERISEQERDTLAQIRMLVEEVCDKFGVGSPGRTTDEKAVSSKQ